MAARLSVGELVERGDLDELLRRIDELVDGAEWDGLLDLRDRCRAAYERGRQLWPASSHAEYRLALHAPGAWAAAILVPGAGQFALGPLTEVAASTHTWEELAPHLAGSPVASVVAQERVLRGDDLSSVALPGELPLAIEYWEPDYPLATYKPWAAEFGGPPEAPPMDRIAGSDATRLDDRDAVAALVELVSPWTSQSNGRVAAVAVAGDGPAAAHALGARAIAPVAETEAFALMAWTAASGGAHGRRRGMAYGRFAAWWTAATLAGAVDLWPACSDDFDGLRWYRWEGDGQPAGWVLRLAADRPDDGMAWAVEATDHKDA